MLDKWFAAAGAAAWGGVAFRRLLPFLSTAAREKVENLCPGPRTVLVAAFPYYAGERPGNLSLYARGEDCAGNTQGIRLSPPPTTPPYRSGRPPGWQASACGGKTAC